MPNCVVKGCKNNSSKIKKQDGITFHTFPIRNENIKEKWIAVLRASRNEPSWNPTVRSVVCSTHFEDVDFYITKKGLRRVVRNGYPKHLPASSSFLLSAPSQAHVPATPDEPIDVDPIQPCTVQTTPVLSSTPLIYIKEESESNFDTPRKHKLRQRILRLENKQKQMKKKVKNLNQAVRRLKERNKSLKEILKNLKGWILKRVAFFEVYDYFDKYTFMCEMYDTDLNDIRELVLHFFPFDNAVQVTDPKKGRNLLKRTQLPTLKKPMLLIGNVINVFGKLLRITVCAPATRTVLFQNSERTFAMIKPVPPSARGKVLTYILKKGFIIMQMTFCRLTKDAALAIYSHHAGSDIMPTLIDYVTSGEVICLELQAPNAIAYWRECLGATDPKEAAPGTLRYLYGENICRNVGHGTSTASEAARMIPYVFGDDEKGEPGIPLTATMENCTCCIIKPHAIFDGNVGAILDAIHNSGKFYVSAMAMFTVKKANADEFYEIYQGVLPEYKKMCIQLAEGRCICLEVKCIDPSLNCVCEFRKLCGPIDPSLCRQIYPETLRAMFGKDIVQNAVHCTDLPEDGALEIEYFFKLLRDKH